MVIHRRLSCCIRTTRSIGSRIRRQTLLLSCDVENVVAAFDPVASSLPIRRIVVWSLACRSLLVIEHYSFSFGRIHSQIQFSQSSTGTRCHEAGWSHASQFASMLTTGLLSGRTSRDTTSPSHCACLPHAARRSLRHHTNTHLRSRTHRPAGRTNCPAARMISS